MEKIALYRYLTEHHSKDVFCEEDCVCCQVKNKEEYNELKSLYLDFKKRYKNGSFRL